MAEASTPAFDKLAFLMISCICAAALLPTKRFYLVKHVAFNSLLS